MRVALAGIIGRFDLAGPIYEGKELLPGVGEPVLELHRQFARRRLRDYVVDGSFERTSSCAIIDGARRPMPSASPSAF